MRRTRDQNPTTFQKMHPPDRVSVRGQDPRNEDLTPGQAMSPAGSQDWDVIACTDGASRGNPGPAASAFILLRDGFTVLEDSRYIGRTTNNVAEYTAIIMALEAAAAVTDRSVLVISDSELVIRQMLGIYQVKKPHLADLREGVNERRSRFMRTGFSHCRREEPCIRRCDALCNRALDDAGR